MGGTPRMRGPTKTPGVAMIAATLISFLAPGIFSADDGGHCFCSGRIGAERSSAKSNTCALCPATASRRLHSGNAGWPVVAN